MQPRPTPARACCWPASRAPSAAARPQPSSAASSSASCSSCAAMPAASSCMLSHPTRDAVVHQQRSSGPMARVGGCTLSSGPHCAGLLGDTHWVGEHSRPIVTATISFGRAGVESQACERLRGIPPHALCRMRGRPLAAASRSPLPLAVPRAGAASEPAGLALPTPSPNSAGIAPAFGVDEAEPDSRAASRCSSSLLA